MRKLTILLLVLFALVVGGVGAAGATSPASVYVVHGINGRDLNLNRALPVDVSVNGACALPGFRFGQIVGPLSLPAGNYDINISLANPHNPCSSAPVIAVSDLPLNAGENASIVAHLTVNGAPTASKFVNNFAASSSSRVIVHHTAAAPTVDIALRRLGLFSSQNLLVEDVSNGAQASADVRPGLWRIAILPANSSTVVFGPVYAAFRPATAYLVYAVGTLEKGTFTLLSKAVRLQR